MPRVDLYDSQGIKKGKTSLPEELFAAKINPLLMTQAVRVYLANQRKARAKTKSRGEVVASKAKIWRQKGTGRARHGSRSAPIFVGGGIAHGPRGEQNFSRKMPKKAKRQALASALTSKLKGKELLIVDGLEKIPAKTQKLVSFLSLPPFKEEKKERLLVLGQDLEKVKLAARNIKGLKMAKVSSLNTYQVLKAGKVIFTKKAIEVLKKTFLRGQESG